jgi:aromatic-L-amino-acid/L-tryptophan decarboxylase
MHPTPIEIDTEEYRRIGYELIDRIVAFNASVNELPVTTGEGPEQLQEILGIRPMPEEGQSPDQVITKAAEFLMKHSLLTGHPKFSGYITSSPAPIGSLADLLAAAVNPNVGANILSPAATEIERQSVRWIASLIGLPSSWGGLMVSGGNMANFTAFLAARTAKAPKSSRKEGISGKDQKLKVYCSAATHTWIEKAAFLFGLGTNALHWIPCDHNNQMLIAELEKALKEDMDLNCLPLMVIANAGDVSTGAVDDFNSIAALCKKYNLWFHIDGAYGIPAAMLPELKDRFEGITEADSIALDPHKWLYIPLEAGCTLVKDPNHLIETFSSHPVYYNFSNNEGPLTLNYYEYGLQNSRGFRALKVWMALLQVGKKGYQQMIADNIRLSKMLFNLAQQHPELEAVSQSLSITTLRYIPEGINPDAANQASMLNELNEQLLNALQKGGRTFLSNAVVNEKYCLRSCIVNFRTSDKDISEIIEIVVDEGRKIYQSYLKEHAAV